MLEKLRLKRKLINPLARTISSTAAGELDRPPWVSANHIFQRHPRLQTLDRCRSLRGLRAFLAYTIVSGLFRNPFVASRILHCCTATAAPPASLSFAVLVFAHMEQPNVFSWNTLIRAFAMSDDSSAAFALYTKMLNTSKHMPDKHTFPFLLKACRSPPKFNLGKLVHGHVLVLGLCSDGFVQTALLTMYFLCGSAHDAHSLFDRMPTRDVVSWTAMISGLIDIGLYEEALQMFVHMRTSDGNVSPNVATLVSAMSACAGLESLAHAKSLHGYSEKVALVGEVFVGNSLIDAYAKCGSIACASRLFDGMKIKDSQSWTTMITAFASHGFGRKALDVFSQMLQFGMLPDSITFVAVLSACSHANLVDEGIEIFNSMERVYGIAPERKHYGCMVDIYSRAGHLAHAYELILNMPMQPNLAILGSLLSACGVQNSIQLAQIVSKRIESLCEQRGGSHVLLSNMYAKEHKWNEVVSIREVTRGDGSKPPGLSWIELRGVVHEFLVEDRSCPLARELQLVLDGLRTLIEGEGII